MNFSDIFSLCRKNLKRHKGRTRLTASGVVIGCVSIVIMISLGIGIKGAMESQLLQSASFTTITVNAYSSNGADEKKITEQSLKEISQIPHVRAVRPKTSLMIDTERANNVVSLGAAVGSGKRYTLDWLNGSGIYFSDFDSLSYHLEEGRLPQREGEILIGRYFAYQFMDTKKKEGQNYISDYNDDPFFNPLKEKLSICTVDYNEDGEMVYNEVMSYTVVGILSSEYFSMTTEEAYNGILMSIEDAENLKKSAARQLHVKYSPSFSVAYVEADEIDSVEGIQNTIKDDFDFGADSLNDAREQINSYAMYIEIALGAIGAVSMLVASIGIANTMIMSVTERTREIGIFKAIGCSVSDIRKVFLTESALIGFRGGIIGIILCYALSIAANKVISTLGILSMVAYDIDTSVDISVIPPWLAVAAVFFCVLIGLAAGAIPSNRACRITVLEALKY